MIRQTTIGIAILFANIGVADASVSVFTNYGNWQAAAGPYSTIFFTEFPAGTIIHEQYANLGVHFTDPIDVIHAVDDLYSDGFGINGALNSTTLEFDKPIQSIGLHFPGSAQIELYSGGQLFYTSPLFGFVGVGFFGGLVSTQPFDKARLFDPNTGFFADNFYFSTVPAPSALGMIALAAIMLRRTRR